MSKEGEKKGYASVASEHELRIIELGNELRRREEEILHFRSRLENQTPPPRNSMREQVLPNGRYSSILYPS